MKGTILIIWQLPQYVLAGFLLTFLWFANAIIECRNDEESLIVVVNIPTWGVSLGRIIILDVLFEGSRRTVMHEYGHSKQSLYLGPLYLLVVGLPSITMNILTRLRVLKARDYYKRWPESWADRLGGVKRV